MNNIFWNSLFSDVYGFRSLLDIRDLDTIPDQQEATELLLYRCVLQDNI